jgi:hypothetical protein
MDMVWDTPDKVLDTPDKDLDTPVLDTPDKDLDTPDTVLVMPAPTVMVWDMLATTHTIINNYPPSNKKLLNYHY